MNLSKKFSSQRSRLAQKNLITILGNIRICIRYLKKALMKQKVFLFIKEKTHFYRKNLLLFISCIKNFGFSKFLFTRRYPVRDEGRREKQNVKNNIILRIFQNLIFKKTQDLHLGGNGNVLMISLIQIFVAFLASVLSEQRTIILRIFQNLIFKKTQNLFWVVDFLIQIFVVFLASILLEQKICY